MLSPGRVPGGIEQDIELSGLTVFVGPNNSGKTQALSEIYGYGNLRFEGIRHIVTDLKFRQLSAEAGKEVQRTYMGERQTKQAAGRHWIPQSRWSLPNGSLKTTARATRS